MADYTVSWKAPERKLPLSTPVQSHYEVHFGELIENVDVSELVPDAHGVPTGSQDFLGVTAPGEYASKVRLRDVNDQPIGDWAIGPVIVIDAEGGVNVNIPEHVDASMKVDILP